MPTFTISIQHCTRDPTNAIKQEKNNLCRLKRKKWTGIRYSYISPKESTDKILESLLNAACKSV